ncbi:MAG: T9SS type A sorting domain-containing protein [Saprospirales bacterium]|nr:T9SS type A sorting domain-containing protein [Saprospirales bacterium]
MKKNFILSLIIIFSGIAAFGQTTATDFTATDCDGFSHHLFSELEAGKVIVMAWVMPCAACLPPSLAAFSAVKNYVDDYPGVVSFYLVDDFGDTPCNTMKSWAGANGLPKANVFSTATIDMGDYGQYGMPKVVVLGGGADHTIFYNENYSTVGVGEAIEAALGLTSITASPRVDLGVILSPNPAQNELHIAYRLPQAAELSAEVLNILGAEIFSIVKDEKQVAGAHEMQVDISGLSNGVYFFRLNTTNGAQVVRFYVAQ